MWLAIGIGGSLYVLLLITLGLTTLSNGHGWLFGLGIPFPLLWLVGAVMGPARGY